MNKIYTQFYNQLCEWDYISKSYNEDDANYVSENILNTVLTEKYLEKYNIVLESLNRYYKYGEQHILSSGHVSYEYLDCKQSLSWPGILENVGALIYNVLDPMTSKVGGLTMGADPLAIATSLHSCYHTDESFLLWFSIRKEQKMYGNQSQIVGHVFNGDDVTILEDVITTGESTIKAIQAAKNHGLIVRQVIALVDRQEFNGLDKIKKSINDEKIPIITLYTKEQVRCF